MVHEYEITGRHHRNDTLVKFRPPAAADAVDRYDQRGDNRLEPSVVDVKTLGYNESMDLPAGAWRSQKGNETTKERPLLPGHRVRGSARAVDDQ